jgi:hypothetical protein
MEAVHEALESTAVVNGGRGHSLSQRSTSSRRAILNHRDELMRFLDEIDGELSVAELRDALTHYD